MLSRRRCLGEGSERSLSEQTGTEETNQPRRRLEYLRPEYLRLEFLTAEAKAVSRMLARGRTCQRTNSCLERTPLKHSCVDLSIEPRYFSLTSKFTRTAILLFYLTKKQELEKSITGIGDYKIVSEAAIKDASKKAHVTTNERLHETDFDDTLSGTTAISVLLRVRCSNVIICYHTLFSCTCCNIEVFICIFYHTLFGAFQRYIYRLRCICLLCFL